MVLVARPSVAALVSCQPQCLLFLKVLFCPVDRINPCLLVVKTPQRLYHYSGVLPPNPSLQASCPILMNAALSFIKAYRLKGDNVSLKKSVCDHFSSEDVELAKKVLWDHCKHDLEAAGLVYHIRRSSDRRSQISANMDDIIQAFLVLDSSDLIPPIYCEATDLLKIPSLSLDPDLGKDPK